MPRLRKAAPSRGFTLVEIVLVLVLMGILSAVAVPRMTDRNALAERASADELRGLLRSARQVAMAQERNVCLLVAPTAVSVVYVTGPACDPARPVPGPGGQGPMVMVAPNNLNFIGPANVRFDARGQLNPLVNVNVRIGQRTWTVDRFTGAIS